MSGKNEVVKVLQMARDQIQLLAAEALKVRDYTLVRSATDLSEQLDAILESPPWGESPEPRDRARKSTRRSAPKARKKPAAEAEGASAHFFRDGEELVKVGKSKQKGSTYTHRMQFETAELLIKHLAQQAGAEKLVRMDDLLEDLTNLRSYQAYMCLAWLRDENLVVQHGRRGYTVSASGGLLKSARASFKKLTEYTP